MDVEPRRRLLAWREPPLDYSSSVERGFRLATERLRQIENEPPILQSFLSLPRERRRLLFENSVGLRTSQVCTEVLDRAQQVWLDDTDEATSLVVLALELTCVLDRATYGEALVNDLEARAFAYRGNIERICGNLSVADAQFERAAALLLVGTGDPMLRAETASLVASLRVNQRRIDEALTYSDKALEIYRQIDDHSKVGKMLVQRAAILEPSNRSEEAVACLTEASQLIDPVEEPALTLAVTQNLAGFKVLDGAYLEAQALLARSRVAAELHGSPRVLLRRLWIEGRISLGTGQLWQAENQLSRARLSFAENGLPYETALISLDLALLYLERGETAQVKALAREMVAFFRSRQVHRETIAAALLFERAAGAEKVTRHWVKELSAYLTKAQIDPNRQFHRPA